LVNLSNIAQHRNNGFSSAEQCLGKKEVFYESLPELGFILYSGGIEMPIASP
jgi:hypothetical protein